MAADWLAAAWDQNAGMYATSPAAAIVEEVAGVWLKDILGLPEQASFALVTGCQMAHVTCLAAARHHLLEQRGWNVEERGLSGSPTIRILASDQRHGSVDRAVRLLGLGTANMEYLATDSQGRLSPEALAKALEERPSDPAIVLVQAGEINIGSFDDFPAITEIAQKHGAWVHVDGAFGLFAAVSPRTRHFVDGLELADSVISDGHKWLNVPYDLGFAFVRDPVLHAGAFSASAAYLSAKDASQPEFMNLSPEMSRRARSLAGIARLIFCLVDL